MAQPPKPNPKPIIDRQGPPTPRDDKKKAVSDVLKRVDMLIKENDLQGALAEAIRAKEIDPRNVYAAAYEERIANLIKEQAAAAEKAAQQRIATATAAPKPEPPKPPTAPPAPPPQPKPTPAPPPQTKPSPEPPKPGTPAGAPSRLTQPSGSDVPLLDRLKKQLESYEKYKKALMDVWSDGAASADEREWLTALRDTLGISNEDHERLEHEVQLEAYLETLKGAWKQGKIKAEGAGLLAEMRTTFKISREDHDKIEARFLAEIQASEKKQAKIVVVDDEEKLLELICQTLQEAGFATLPFTTSDEAYGYLKAGSVPDLILCDVNLETSTMGGFSFYEKLQWMDHLTEVPFIFLTGLADEVLIRTGKELGVDDYLTKPISDQTLVATVRGKLKRFQRIKQRRV